MPSNDQACRDMAAESGRISGLRAKDSNQYRFYDTVKKRLKELLVRSDLDFFPPIYPAMVALRGGKA